MKGNGNGFVPIPVILVARGGKHFGLKRKPKRKLVKGRREGSIGKSVLRRQEVECNFNTS